LVGPKRHVVDRVPTAAHDPERNAVAVYYYKKILARLRASSWRC